MKKTGWVHPNDAAFYIGTVLGEPRNAARTNGKTVLRGWADQGLVDAKNWPYSADGNENPSARVNAEQVCAEVTAMVAVDQGQLAADWELLEVDLKMRLNELGVPERDHVEPHWHSTQDAIRWCASWLSARRQRVPADRTIRRRIKPWIDSVKACH